MDFYFTDRKYNLLGIASTDPDLNSDIVGIGDISGTSGEYQSIAGGYRSYSGTVYFDETSAEHVKEMCAFGNFVLYKDRSGESVWLTILTSRYDALTGTDEITAEDASIDLINGTVTAYKATTPMAITDYVSLLAADSGFEIGVNEVPSYKRQLEWDSDDSSILTRLLSVATQFDVEISFRFEVDGLSVVHKYIDFRKRIGDDNGITLYTNVSLNKIVTTTDGADLCTSIVGTGATPEGANQPISLKGYSWTDPGGRFVLDKDGVLRDPVALRTWSRLLSATNPAPTSAHIVRHKTYEAATQATLLQSVLADLKKYNHPAVNYEVDIAVLPENVHIGDTITLVDEAERLNLSARVLELRYSYSQSQGTAVLGDYLLLADQVDPELRDLANSLKQAGKLHQYWPWTRYADDDTGNGISALPAGKAYMAVVWNDQSAVPSDDPADYAGRWQKVKGDTGVGEAGPKGADGRTSYFHTAWADSIDGKTGFTVSGGDGKKYIGTYSDFTLVDSKNPADYNWALFKGEDGDVGPKGPQGLPGTNGSDGRTTYAHFAYANSQDGKTDFSTTDSNRKYIGFYSDFTSGDSTNQSAYNWSLIKGADGADGKDGVPGKAGADGKTPYFHIAYADSGDGNTNFSLDTPGYRKYIGSYTDFTQADSTNPALYSWQLVQGPKGDTGKDGVAGKDGVGIKSTQIMYAQSTYGTTAPTTGWTAQVPTLIKGQYLWTQTTWVYTDNTGEAGYTVSYNAKDGNTGSNGIAGKDGVGIQYTTITYQGGTSGTVHPTGTWVANPPSVTGGNYLWTRTVWSYTDGTSETGYSVAKAGEKGDKGDQGLQGLQGPKGDQGIAGPKGIDGKTQYTHIAYANSADGVTDFTVSDSNRTYVGMYVDFTSTDSTKPADYSWTLIKGADGANGTPGKAGTDGKTPYFHTAWATADGGTSGFSTTDSAGKSYLGVYTDYNQADSTTASSYSWSLIKGPQGIKGDTGATGAQGLQGPQGPAGKDITSYASGTALPATVAPANSQFWLTNSAGVATKFYKSTGTAWVEQQISAAAINAATFNGLSFTGVTFNGSTFMSANSRVIADGEEELYTAGTTLNNTQTLDKFGYTSVAQGSIMGNTTPNSFKATTTISNTGSIRSRADLASGDWSIITIDPTHSAMTMSNSQGASGTLNADYLSRVNKCGTKIWTGTLVMNDAQSVTPTLKMSQCLNGWALLWSVFYGNGQNNDSRWFYQYVSKNFVEAHSGQGITMAVAAPNGSTNWANNATKYLYFTDSTIKGYTGNNQQTGYSYALREVVAW